MVAIDAPGEDDVRLRILTRARVRFLAEGFVSVSVDDLCNELGMSKKTFYKIFPSKDELLVEEAEWMMGEARSFITGLLESNKSFVEKALAISTGVATTASKISRILIRDVQRHTPDLWKKIEEFRLKTIQSTFSRLVEQGMKEGYVRKDIDLRIFLLAYVAAIDQIMTPSVLAIEPFSPLEAIHGIFTIFFHGILTDQGRASIIPVELFQPTRTDR